MSNAANRQKWERAWRSKVERIIRFDLDGLDELLTRDPREYTDVAFEMETLQEVSRAMVEVLDAQESRSTCGCPPGESCNECD